MLNVVDKGLANITAKLRQQKMWDETLLVLTSDNGGDSVCCTQAPGAQVRAV